MVRRDAAVVGCEVQYNQRTGHLRLRDHWPRAIARHVAATRQNLRSLQRKIRRRGEAECAAECAMRTLVR